MDYQEFHKLWMSQNGANRVNFHFGTGVSVDESIEEDSVDKKDMSEEEETRTEVVVRPDGSKVLMITVTVGGQEAYERLGSSGKTLPEAGQDEIEILKVTDIEVVSLHNGVSFYYNCDTEELQCINHNDGRPGRHALWSKTLTYEDWERCCDEMLDRYADKAAGQFVYRYQAYLRHEEFWDMANQRK